MAILIGAHELIENPEARQLHKAGLDAEKTGDFERAYESFDNARQILSGLEPTLDCEVQSARVTRDRGFTAVRHAIAGSDLARLSQAQLSITNLSGTTQLLLRGIDANYPPLTRPNADRQKVRREVSAEHGATVNLIGRALTVREVLLGNDTRQASEFDTDELMDPYEDAHTYLAKGKGSNGYYLVANALTAARQEVLNGRQERVEMWVGRAASGSMWTAGHDLHNMKSVILTYGNRRRDSRSYQAALESVKKRP